jgi:cytochrome c oxidase subunit 3
LNQTQTKQRLKPLSSAELGTLVGLSSFGMLFATFILSYLLSKARFPAWPPPGIAPPEPLLPTLATGVLIASSLLVHMAMGALDSGRIEKFRKLWGGALALGCFFVVIQIGFWAQLISNGLSAQSHLYGASIYTLTGLHAIHIVVGLGVLAWVLAKAMRPQFLEQKSEAPKLASWIWHFLDIVWILMFVILVDL